MYCNITNVSPGVKAFYDIDKRRLTSVLPNKTIRLDMHPVAIRALVKAQVKGKLTVEVDDPEALDLPIRPAQPTVEEAKAVAATEPNTTPVGLMPTITADQAAEQFPPVVSKRKTRTKKAKPSELLPEVEAVPVPLAQQGTVRIKRIIKE